MRQATNPRTTSLGTNFEEALVEFREERARQRKEFESVQVERPAGAFKDRDFEKPYLFSRMQSFRGLRS